MKIIGVTGPSLFQPFCVKAIEDHLGANPCVLYQNRKEDVLYWLNQCDGVMLAGGVDLHPRLYGQSVLNEHNFGKFDVRRDLRELQIIDHCRKNNKPMMGICRGHQMIGVSLGMTFVPDLSESILCHQPSAQKVSHEPEEPMHLVSLLDRGQKLFEEKANSSMKEWEIIERIRGEKFTKHMWVNSFHHQGLLFDGKIPEGVQVLATARGVGKSKIVEMMRGNNWISCQWHPEYDYDNNTASRIILDEFKALIEARKEQTA